MCILLFCIPQSYNDIKQSYIIVHKSLLCSRLTACIRITGVLNTQGSESQNTAPPAWVGVAKQPVLPDGLQGNLVNAGSACLLPAFLTEQQCGAAKQRGAERKQQDAGVEAVARGRSRAAVGEDHLTGVGRAVLLYIDGCL